MKFKEPFLTIAFLIFFCSCGISQNNIETTAKEEGHYITHTNGILGTYATPPRLANGQVDEKRLIAELKDIHANTYNWLLWRRKEDGLDALKHFLPLAREAGIEVWVTLVPPSEPPASEPYRLDYDQWATKLAILSKKEPNLVAWSIDDFVHNLKLFTPEYVKGFLSRAHAINPNLAFIPCCYFSKITNSFVVNYAHLLGGILFPYRAESVGANLQDATHVKDEIAKIRNMVGQRLPIIIDVYATAHSSLGSSTAKYVGNVIKEGMKYADGVIIYTHQDPIKNAEKYKIIKKEFSKGFN